MRIKIIQWNIKISSQIESIVAFLKTRIEANTIVNLMEVSQLSYEYIKAELKLDSAFS